MPVEIDPKALEAALAVFERELFGPDLHKAHQKASPERLDFAQTRARKKMSAAISTYLAALPAPSSNMVRALTDDEAVDLFLDTHVLPLEGRPGMGVAISDYLRVNAADAMELGVKLTDGKFSGLDYIRGDEFREAYAAIVLPGIRAIRSALLPNVETRASVIEECAKVAETLPMGMFNHPEAIAKAIRALATQPNKEA